MTRRSTPAIRATLSCTLFALAMSCSESTSTDESDSSQGVPSTSTTADGSSAPSSQPTPPTPTGAPTAPQGTPSTPSNDTPPNPSGTPSASNSIPPAPSTPTSSPTEMPNPAPSDAPGTPNTEPSSGGSGGAPIQTGGGPGIPEPAGGTPGAGGTAEVPREPVWTGAWGTAPQLAESGTPSDNRPPNPPGLVNNTLRQVIFPTLSGTKVRIELSNGWGNSAVELRKVHLARAREGGAIDTATDTPLTFEGSASVTIPQGGTIWSDPVDFQLAALERVSITIHFGGTVPTDYTSHPGSRTTSYIQSGDAVSSADLSSGTRTDHWYFITKLDTETTDPNAGAIVTFGDSITDGRGSTTNANNRWPDGLARRLQADPTTSNVSVLNMGIGGNMVLGQGLGPSGVDRFERDVLGQSNVRWLIILHGINDVGNANNNIAPQLISAYQDFIRRAQAAGIKVYGVPLLPFGNSSYASQAQRVQAHTDVNAWVRTSDAFDAVIDLSPAVANPNNPAQLDSAYLFENDYLHLNAAGYQAMADAIDSSLFH